MSQLPSFRSGQRSVKASQMNYAIDMLAELNATAIRRKERVPFDAATPIGLRRCEVRIERADFLECTYPGGLGVFYVAKPYLLRVSPFNGSDAGDASKERAGIRYVYSSPSTRTAYKDGEPDADTGEVETSEEEQVIVASYEPGDVIYAATRVWNGGELLSRDLSSESPTIRVGAVDMNVDGRMWARA